MPHIENARCDAGAVSKFGGFDTQHTRTTEEMQYKALADEGNRRLAGPRFEHLCRQVHAPGRGRMAESQFIASRIETYAALDPAVLRAVGGDSFPPLPLEVVR